MLQFVGRGQKYAQQPVPDFGDQSCDRCGFLVVGIRDDDGVGFLIGPKTAAPRQRVGGVRCPRWPPADRVERKPQTCGRLALQQHNAAAPHLPICAGPAGLVVAAVQGQHVSGGLGDRLVEPGE